MKLSYIIAFAAVVVASTAIPANAATGLTTNNVAELQVVRQLGAGGGLRGSQQGDQNQNTPSTSQND
ncbi:hypothetical protein L917_10095, partial [Phytophthora nicotianae]